MVYNSHSSPILTYSRYYQGLEFPVLGTIKHGKVGGKEATANCCSYKIVYLMKYKKKQRKPTNTALLNL